MCEYERPLICYPGQEPQFEAKRRNITISLAVCSGLVVRPGEVFSFWLCVGRPTRAAGYSSAAALKDGLLTEDIGGAICFASTLLYNAGLLSSMTIVERHCHSVDSYGENRYFELARDAAVEYAYPDLRLRNDIDEPLMLTAQVGEDLASVQVRSRHSLDLTVAIVVAPATVLGPPVLVTRDDRLPPGQRIVDDAGLPGRSVSGSRTVTYRDATRTEPLPDTLHKPRPRRERHGPALARAWPDC